MKRVDVKDVDMIHKALKRVHLAVNFKFVERKAKP
jgi:hypothetical protein